MAGAWEVEAPFIDIEDLVQDVHAAKWCSVPLQLAN